MKKSTRGLARWILLMILVPAFWFCLPAARRLVEVPALAAPMTFVVNSSDDADDGVCNAAHCSLREAIKAANANSGADTINFNIPGAALFASAGVVPSDAERQSAIAAFDGGGTAGRITAFRSVADSNSLRAAEFRPAFVLMQYFGYLRRNPTDAPDGNDSGYQFWLQKLNQFNGNFVQAEMVKAFITSGEYRQRFGQP